MLPTNEQYQHDGSPGNLTVRVEKEETGKTFHINMSLLGMLIKEILLKLVVVK